MNITKLRGSWASLITGLGTVLLSCACSSTHASANDTSGGPATGTDAGPKTTNADGTPVDPAVVGCDIHTKFDGDDLCIKPPPADQGFQVRVGPTNYDDPDELAKYVIDAGAETNDY
jgi:hypothetical protein